MRARATARILLVIRNQKWTTSEALAELLDNSFGELRGRASTVWINWSPRKRLLTILDNGQGMQDVIDLFTTGQGTISGAGDTGFYGYGGSAALVWLADHAEVTTLREGRVAGSAADWAHCIAVPEFPDINRRWRNATVATCPTELLEQHHGTFIRLRIRPRLMVYAEVIQERLSRMFAPALRNGREIIWSTVDTPIVTNSLHPWNPGNIEDAITATVTLENGLSAQLYAGRVDDLSIANSKLSINYVYRRVKETVAGFKRPVQGAVGYVDLSADWLPYLTPTKDDIQEEGREFEDALMAKIADVLQPLIDDLQRAKRRRIFTNVKINLIHKFQRGFKVPVTEPSGPKSPGPPGPGPSPPGPEPRQPRQRLETRAAEIQITEASDEELNGLLCLVVMEKNKAEAFVNEDHPVVVKALDAEPINQMLLEQVLIGALGKELVQQNALVTFGLLPQRAADELVEKCRGDSLDVLQHVIRFLTDGIESSIEKDAEDDKNTVETVTPKS